MVSCCLTGTSRGTGGSPRNGIALPIFNNCLERSVVTGWRFEGEFVEFKTGFVATVLSSGWSGREMSVSILSVGGHNSGVVGIGSKPEGLRPGVLGSSPIGVDGAGVIGVLGLDGVTKKGSSSLLSYWDGDENTRWVRLCVNGTGK